MEIDVAEIAELLSSRTVSSLLGVGGGTGDGILLLAEPAFRPAAAR